MASSAEDLRLALAKEAAEVGTAFAISSSKENLFVDGDIFWCAPLSPEIGAIPLILKWRGPAVLSAWPIKTRLLTVLRVSTCTPGRPSNTQKGPAAPRTRHPQREAVAPVPALHGTALR
jgi:hypothetical protein